MRRFLVGSMTLLWARERAKQNHGYIKSGKEAVRGTWELSSKGKTYYDQLVAELKEIINDKTQKPYKYC